MLYSNTLLTVLPAGIGKAYGILSLEEQSNKIVPITTTIESEWLVNDNCTCSPFCLSEERSNSYHLVAYALCLMLEFQSNTKLFSQEGALTVGVVTTSSSTYCMVKLSKPPSVCKRRYALSLLMASTTLLATLICMVALAGTVKFFTSALLLVTGVAKAISCTNTTSDASCDSMVHTVL